MGLNNCKDRSEDNNYVEGVVCQESDVAENGMKVCDIGTDGDKVLIVKKNGQLSALGTKCSHYGAPLATGALGDNRIRCPWHGACFNIQTGDIEDFPGLDSIPCYNVEVTPDGGVKVRAKLSELKANKRVKTMAMRDANNNNTFVIVGGGPAGQVCAETLRQEGFTGKLILISADKHTPYDRVKLSKILDSTIDKIQLRPPNFYKDNNITLMLDTEITSVDPEKKSVKLSNGDSVTYSSIFIATGSKARSLNIPGADLNNIFTLRSIMDANKIHESLSTEANVVVYGSSFIGMEAAAYCQSKTKSVTVVGRSAVPFQESLGREVGERVAKFFTDKGVKLKMNTTVSSFNGENGKVNEAVLSDGTKLPADVVILGLGATPATSFLNNTNIKLNENGTVPVNKFLETNCSGIYAGGDIAEAPVFAINDTPRAIGHYGLAQYHGKIAALNMMSHATQLRSVPFFWTALFGTSFRFAGHTSKDHKVIMKGDVDGLKFAAYYCKDGKITGLTTVNTDSLAAQFGELLHSGKHLTEADIEKNPLDWYKK